MFSYQKRLLYPVYVEHPDLEFAKRLATHLSGEENEFETFFRLIHQRLLVTNPYIRDLIGMITAEELGHIEVISMTVKKLGLSESIQQNPFTAVNEQINLDLTEMLQINGQKEERTKKKYLQNLEETGDANLKRLLRFLANREEVHQKVFEKLALLVAHKASNEQYSCITHEYKMSLRIIK